MLDFALLVVIRNDIKMHKWVLVTHSWTSNFSMEVLESTENDLQIDHRAIGCYVIILTTELQRLRTQYAMNPLNMGMFVNFPEQFFTKSSQH
ncbi:hypothetical protein A6E07_11025 [Vibrio cyclitrophicus]|nr:hypothetical protein A6E07_11025 [Vibrio cyclitrophicus]